MSLGLGGLAPTSKLPPAWGCRAWVNFAGATGVIAGSYNVASVTRNAQGDWTINFSNPLTNANYVIQANCRFAASGTGNIRIVVSNAMTPTVLGCRLSGYGNDGNLYDALSVYACIFGDL